MSTIPCTILVTITDPINFPLKMAYVVMKQIFRFGVKKISLKEGKIFIELTYSPKTSTLLRKFGNLPVKYVRTKLENEEEFQLFEKAIKRYVFDMDQQQEEEDPLALDNVEQSQHPKKKKLKVSGEEPSTSKNMNINLIDDDDANEEWLESQRMGSVTPELIRNGIWAPPKLTDLSANIISHKIIQRVHIDMLEIPQQCKDLINIQYWKNYFDISKIEPFQIL